MTWPPESLLVDTDEIINECELMELVPERAEGKQFVPIVEMAALLCSGEYLHARHLWRRWKDRNPPALLAEWWRVASAILARDASGIWDGLEQIRANHPAPLGAYAVEVGTAYRKRILQTYASPDRPPVAGLLGFASATELARFCDLHRVGPPYRNRTEAPPEAAPLDLAGLTQVVSFLETTKSYYTGTSPRAAFSK